jgi:glucokinase
MSEAALVADIGGTNARFALVGADGAPTRLRVFWSRDFPTIEQAISTYLADETVEVDRAAIAVASPVTGDRIALTNSPWSFSTAALKARFRWDRLAVVNDFAATALAVPRLRDAERFQLGNGAPCIDAPAAIVGPGSGLGVAGLIRGPTGWIALPGEGGHATIPATDEREASVIARLRRRFDHVSAERVLSGPGLVNLDSALAELAGAPARDRSPEEIVASDDPTARGAVDLFCALLGSFTGDVALTLGARGGVYVAGGIVPKLGLRFTASAFRERFIAKGRFRDYLDAIPTFVVTHPAPALLGLASVLSQEAS